jgi:hypothetical protein
MSKIESYPLAPSPISGSDKLIGTDTANNDATKNFTVSELASFITLGTGFVPYTGATQNVNLGTRSIFGSSAIFSGIVNASQLNVQFQLYLGNSQGTAGQVIKSNGPGAAPQWSNPTAGAQGIQGPVGPAGPVGPVGPAGLNWQSSWVSGSSYVVDDAVGYGGASYFCILATSGTITPDLDTTHWALLAAQGAQGPAGATGAQGPTGPQGIPGLPGTETLQTVTTAGNTTSNSMISSNDSGSAIVIIKPTTQESVYIGTEIGSGVLGITNAGAIGNGEVRANLLTDVRDYELPDESGTFVLRVNGTAPNSAGNVTITAAAPYLVYTAQLSILAGGVLDINVLQNTIGDGSGDGVNDIAWILLGNNFRASMTAGPFTLDKTLILPSFYYANQEYFGFLGLRNNNTLVIFNSAKMATGVTSYALASRIFVEIRVYP